MRTYALAANPPAWFDNILDYSMDYRVLAYLIAISIGTGLLFGLAPASKLSKLNVNATLKDGARGSTGSASGKNLSSLLVIGEIALAIVLLAGAGVMMRSFLNIYTADLGVKTANVLIAHVGLPFSRYPKMEAHVSFFDRLKTRLEAIPGVESAAIASYLPTAGSAKLPFELDGTAPTDVQRRPTLSQLVIGPGYFRTMGTAILSGRDFRDTDGPLSVSVAIVNEAFAHRYWPGTDPLRKRLRLFTGKTPEPWLTVVGVAPDIVQNSGVRQEPDPLVYLSYRQKQAPAMWIAVRTRVPPGGVMTAFRHEFHTMDSMLTLSLFSTLDHRLERNYKDKRFFALLFLILAAIALLLASVGLYAVIANSVSQRTQEIGVRMAIGATARDILHLVFKQGMLQLGIGLTIGLAASFAVNRVLKAELVQVSPNDPITLVIASAALILAAMMGCLIPARRAMRVDPIVALRHD